MEHCKEVTIRWRHGHGGDLMPLSFFVGRASVIIGGYVCTDMPEISSIYSQFVTRVK